MSESKADLLKIVASKLTREQQDALWQQLTARLTNQPVIQEELDPIPDGWPT